MINSKIFRAISVTAAVALFVLDRILKYYSSRNLTGRTINLIGDLFSLNYTRNYRIALSLPLENSLLLIAVGIIVVAVLCVLLARSGSIPTRSSALIFIIAGALSNLFDRYYYGYVIDYFDLAYFSVFNLADLMIVAGALLLA